ncbi:MAG: radical SAM protein [Chloroflexota bacterium]
MLIQSTPDPLIKIEQIGTLTDFEPAGDQPQHERRRPFQARSLEDCISHVATPGGRMPVLKTMLTTACERNCNYCPFRAGRGQTRRITIKPEELAAGFDALQRAGKVRGLFLSSGIIRGSVTTQDKIIDTAEILRRKYNYRGYLHLKIMPGIEYDQLFRLMQLANRVSVNLEGPTEERLRALAPRKNLMNELLQMLRWAADIRRQHPHLKLADTVTQFVAGAVGDTDLELLSISQPLYRKLGLKRIYYSGFSPVVQTPFENLPATDPLREYRLYQASFLIRDYGWDIEDLFFNASGNLDLHTDPKKAWADAHLRQSPVDLMTAEREQLMRVPGIGPKTADAILRARRHTRLTDLSQLRSLHIRSPEAMAPYILLDGRQPASQLRLF